MEVIKELISAYKIDGLRSKGVRASSKSRNLVEKFIGLILEEKANTDREIAMSIYDSNKLDHRYRNLKKRVKHLLIDIATDIDLKHLRLRSEYMINYDICFKAYQKLVRLSGLPIYKTVVYIIKPVYNTALKFQFYDLLFYYSYHLIRVYALQGDIKSMTLELTKFLHYQNELNHYYNAKVVLLETNAIMVRKSSLSRDQVQDISSKVNALLEQDIYSHDTKSMIWASHVYNLMVKGDLDALVDHVDGYEDLINELSKVNPQRVPLLVIQKLLVLLQVKDYEAGLLFSSLYETKIVEKKNNWLVFKRYEFCHAINIDIERAVAVLNNVLTSDYFRKSSSKFVNQIWLIHEAYLKLVLYCRNNQRGINLNIFKLINDVDLYSKDKSGYNFSIVVLELIYWLVMDKVDEYIDRMASLSSYRIRHLKGQMFKRSNVFSQLLLSIDKYSFNVKLIEAKSRSKYSYLKSLNDRLSINEWEIVDYATLWDITLDILKRK